MLTLHQQEREDEVIQFIKDKQRIILISGSAGTGKTFMVNHLIRRIKAECYERGIVYVTAPTHKALGILKTKIDPEPYIQFKTIHSGLQLKRRFINKEQVFVKPDFYNPRYPPFENGVLLICDEASMIGNKEIRDKGKVYKGMLDLIEEFKDQMTIIFLGDIKQLNPVNEMESPVFAKDYPTVTLTEYKRQADGNPIIELSNSLELIWKKQPRLIDAIKREVIETTTESNGVQTIEKLTVTTDIKIGYTFTADRDRIIDRLAAANGTNEYKYLAYTNVDVDTMNRDVRKRIYGEPDKIELGEILIFNAPYKEHMNNEEVKVNTLEIIDKQVEVPTSECIIGEVDGQLDIKNRTKIVGNTIVRDSLGNPIRTYDTIPIKCYLINGSIFVVHEDAEKLFAYKLARLERDADRGEMDYKAKYFFKEQVADLTYAHAITVHKSQGSTYSKVFVNISNLAKDREYEERTRMTYTAITRASEVVILYNVR